MNWRLRREEVGNRHLGNLGGCCVHYYVDRQSHLPWFSSLEANSQAGYLKFYGNVYSGEIKQVRPSAKSNLYYISNLLNHRL